MRIPLLFVAIAATASAPALCAETYRIVPGRSSLVVRTYRGGLASAFGHDHAIRATSASGEIRYDPRQPASSSVEVTVPVSSLVVDDPIARSAMQLGPGPSEADRRKISATMMSPGQLDAARFPSLSFRSTRCEANPDGTLHLFGELTLHGVTRPEDLVVRVRAARGELVGDGELSFNQSDFGITPFSGGPFGQVKNQDRLKMRIHLVATR